jgi:PAS domain-containing protein
MTSSAPWRRSDTGTKRTLEVHGARSIGPDGKTGFDTVWFRDISKSKQKAAELKQRVEDLASLSAEYRNTLELTGIPVWVRGPGLALVYCNRAFADAVEEASPAAAVAGCAEIAGGPTGWGRDLAEEAQPMWWRAESAGSWKLPSFPSAALPAIGRLWGSLSTAPTPRKSVAIFHGT